MENNIDNILKLYAGNLSYSEIAKQLGITAGSVSGKIARYKKKHPNALLERKIGAHPQGKTFGRAIPIMKPNRNTVVFKRKDNKSMTKGEMRAMLRLAVENTK